MAVLISVALFLAALALVAVNLIGQRRQQRLVTQRLQGDTQRNDKAVHLPSYQEFLRAL